MNEAIHIEFGRRSWPVLGALLLVLALGGCTGDSDDNQNQIIVQEDVFDEDATPDAGPDADSDTGLDVGPDAEDAGADADVDEPEEDVEEIDHCAPYIDLGDLEPGEEYPVTLDFTEESAQWSTRCENESDGGSVMIAMVLPTFSVLHVESDTPLGLEMRFGDCGRETNRYMCATDEFAVPSGFGEPQGYLILEALDDSVPDQVEITVTAAQAPACIEEEGQSECIDADSARVCRISISSPDVPRWEEGQCSGGCEEGQCVGDSCSAPLSMSSGETLVFDNLPLRDLHSEYQGPGCSLSDGDDDGLELWGRELVIELSDLIEGDEVAIDVDVRGLLSWAHEPINLEGQVVATIKDDCAAESACLAVWNDFEDQLHFEVPADGDYFLVIESRTDEFDAQIEVAVEIN